MPWYKQYLGIPWKENAKGPNFFSCENLILHCMKTHCNKNISLIPDYYYDEWNPKKINQALTAEISSGRWTKLDEPEEECLILLSEHTIIHHVAMFIDGRVFHAKEGFGVCIEPLEKIKNAGFKRIEYWRWNGS